MNVGEIRAGGANSTTGGRSFAGRFLAPDRLPQLMLVLVSTAVGIWARGRWLSPMRDNGFSWSLAYRLGHGEVLYRDVYLPYGPLSPYLLAATGRPFAFSCLWYLLVNWIPAVAVAWLLLECGRRCLSVFANFALLLLLIGLSLFAGGPGRLVLPYYPGVVHALAFALGAMLLLLAKTGRLGTLGLFAGMLAGLAFACKGEVGVAALVGLLAAAVAGRPKPFTWIVRVVLGFGVVAAAAFAFALRCAPLASLRSDSHLWPLDPVPPQQLAPIFRIASGIANPQWALDLRSTAFRVLVATGFLAAVAMLLARERSPRRWLPLAGLFGVLAVWRGFDDVRFVGHANPLALSMLAAFLVAGLAFARRTTAQRPFLVAFGIFAGLAGGRAAFSRDAFGPYAGAAHAAESLTWVVLLSVFVPILLTGGGVGALWARRLLSAAIVVVAMRYVWHGIPAMRAPANLPFETRLGTVYLGESHVRFFEVLARQLHPGERVLVLPEISALDVIFDVHQDSPLEDHLPGWLGAESERALISRFEHRPPEAIVVFERFTGEFGVKPFGEGFGVVLADWVRRRYAIVAQTPAGAIWRPVADNPLP